MNKIKRNLIIIGAVIILAIIAVASVLRVVEPTERAVIVRLGNVIPVVHSNGLLMKYPLIESVETFDLAPQKIELDIGLDEKAAATKDMQSIGFSAAIFYRYDADRILTIVEKYNKSAIKDLFNTSIRAALKDEIGKYTIYEIIENQDSITAHVKRNLRSRTSEHPIELVDVAITNWDWPDEFEKMVNQTMTRAQEVKQAEQLTLKQIQENERNMAIQEYEYNKKIKEAEGELEATKRRSEAIRTEADAQAYKNKVLAANWAIEKQIKELEIERVKAERWNGQYVPTNNYGPIPLANGSLLGK